MPTLNLCRLYRLVVVTISVTIIIFPIIPVMIVIYSKFIAIYKNSLLLLITPYIINDSSSLFHVSSLLKINIIIKRNFSTRHCIKSIIARKSFEFLLNFSTEKQREKEKKKLFNDLILRKILVPWTISGYARKKKKERKR